MDLSELAVKANEEHCAYEDAQISALDHAIKCGEYLIEAKSKIEHGKWSVWIETNCRFGVHTARDYMRISANRERVLDLGTVRAAVAALAEPREPRVVYGYKPEPVELGVPDDLRSEDPIILLKEALVRLNAYGVSSLSELGEMQKKIAIGDLNSIIEKAKAELDRTLDSIVVVVPDTLEGI